MRDEIMAGTGRRALPVACHVGRWTEVDHLVETAYGEFDHIDVLVNNAGMSPLYEKLSLVTEGLFDKVVAINRRGPFRLSAPVGERMIGASGGSIINRSSISSIRPQMDDLPYAAAKAALNAMTVGFASAFGPKVRVNALLAGPFRTESLIVVDGRASNPSRLLS